MDTVLRPMSTSQVLDRTFSLYRQNFLLFAGIAALPPALLLLGQLGFVGVGTLSVLSGRAGLQIAGIVAAVLTGMALLALWISVTPCAQAHPSMPSLACISVIRPALLKLTN